MPTPCKDTLQNECAVTVCPTLSFLLVADGVPQTKPFNCPTRSVSGHFLIFAKDKQLHVNFVLGAPLAAGSRER